LCVRRVNFSSFPKLIKLILTLAIKGHCNALVEDVRDSEYSKERRKEGRKEGRTTGLWRLMVVLIIQPRLRAHFVLLGGE